LIRIFARLIILKYVYKRVAIGIITNANHVMRLTSIQLVSKEIAVGTLKIDAHLLLHIQLRVQLSRIYAVLLLRTNASKRVALGETKNAKHVPRLLSIKCVLKEGVLGTPKVNAYRLLQNHP